MKTLPTRFAAYFALSLALCMYSPRVAAQAAVAAAPKTSNAPKATSKDSINLYQLDEVPASPAFTFLGTTPGKVERPGTPKALAFALVNAVDTSGNVKSGIAFDVGIARLFPNHLLPSLQTYQNHWLNQVIANTSLSLATAQAAGDSGSTDISYGLRIVLLNGNDPMRDRAFTEFLAQGSAACDKLVDLTHAPTAKEIAAHTACLDKNVQNGQNVKRQQGRSWNRSSLAIAAAGGTRLVGNKWDSQSPLGFRTWASGAIPLGNPALILGQLTFDATKDPLVAKKTATATSGAVRALMGTENYHVFLDFSRNLQGKTSDRIPAAEFSAGLEFKASEQLWLSTGVGSRYRNLGESGKAVIAANLRWRVLASPQFARNP